MKTPKLNGLQAVLMGCAALFLSCACSGNTKEPRPDVVEHSTAVFDYFNYKGQDEFYARNPLPDQESFYNPVLPGWYSDPSVCSDGENYFMVTSTFTYFPGIPLLHSKDLVNWTQIGHVLNRPSQLDNFIGQPTPNGGIYAPAISYNPHNQTYYVITTNVGAGNFFVKTKDPFGEWSEPVYLPEVDGIAPSFFFDEDGKAYIVNNSLAPDNKPLYDGHRTIRIREFDLETETTKTPERIIVNGGVNIADEPSWIEGPHLYKINNRYLLMAAEGGTSLNHSEVVFYADNPMGPYKPWKGNPILTQRHLEANRPNAVTCVGHADIIQSHEGDWWAFFLGCRPVKGGFENLGRETFMMPVRWSDDGFPYMTTGNETVPMILSRPGTKRNTSVASGNFEKPDSFDAPTLHPEWISLRTPVNELYSLSKNPGFLTLKCSSVSSRELKTPAFIARRLQHHAFECTTRMFFEPQNERQAAGVLVYKDETHQYFMAIRKLGNSREVLLEKIRKGDSQILARQTLPQGNEAIKLKVSSPNGLTFDFHYAHDREPWQVLAEKVDAAYLSTASSFGFTGTTIGMYAVE